MTKKDKQYEMIQTIAELAEELGWNIIIPKNEDDADVVAGLIMGTPDFMEEVHMSPDNIEEIIKFDKGPLH